LRDKGVWFASIPGDAKRIDWIDGLEV